MPMAFSPGSLLCEKVFLPLAVSLQNTENRHSILISLYAPRAKHTTTTNKEMNIPTILETCAAYQKQQIDLNSHLIIHFSFLAYQTRPNSNPKQLSSIPSLSVLFQLHVDRCACTPHVRAVPDTQHPTSNRIRPVTAKTNKHVTEKNPIFHCSQDSYISTLR